MGDRHVLKNELDVFKEYGLFRQTVDQTWGANTICKNFNSSFRTSSNIVFNNTTGEFTGFADGGIYEVVGAVSFYNLVGLTVYYFEVSNPSPPGTLIVYGEASDSSSRDKSNMCTSVFEANSNTIVTLTSNPATGTGMTDRFKTFVKFKRIA